MITEEIKAGTLDNHIRLEQSKLLQPLSNKSLTKENYIHILLKFYGFFHPLENVINNFDQLQQFLPDLSSRRKSEMLKNDLQVISGKDTLQPIPLCTNLPLLKQLGQAFGGLYVMEGSTLGGKFIYKTVKEQLGLDHQTGASFFYGYGTDTGNKWKTFQQALIAFENERQENHLVIDAANETFSKFKHWIDTTSSEACTYIL
jgi:heme oxygenase